MSYKHANAVAVKSKTRGMQNLVFYRLACLIQDDGYLIEGQEVLAAILRISIGCLRSYTNYFQEIGELQKIGGRGNGNATRYRSLLGEMETKDMLAYFKSIEAERKHQLEVIKGIHHAPFNEDTKGTHGAPLGDTKGTPQNLKGTPQNLKGTPQNLKGTHGAPSRTTRTTRKTRTQNKNLFLEKELTAKGKTMRDWQKNFKTNPLLKDEIAERMASQHEYKPALLATECMTFTREAIASGKHSEDWVQEYRDWLRPKLQAYSKGSHYG
jgi:hypothetical protein